MSVAPKLLAFFALLTFVTGCARGYGPVDVESFADAGVTLDGQVEPAAHADEGDHPRSLEAGAALFAEGVVAQPAPKQSPAPDLAPLPDADAAMRTASSVDAGAAPSHDLADAAVAPTHPSVPSLLGVPDAGSAVPTGSLPTSPVPDASTPAQGPQPAVDAGAAETTKLTDLDAGSTNLSPACTPGAFAGAFDGKIALGTGTSLPISGSIALMLSVSADGHSLQITRGVVTAAGPGGIPLQATLSGEVDCASGQLRDGKLSGSYGQAGSPQSLTFAGDASGQYASPSGTVAGSWTANVPATPVQAMGTFSATRTP